MAVEVVCGKVIDTRRTSNDFNDSITYESLDEQGTWFRDNVKYYFRAGSDERTIGDPLIYHCRSSKRK